MHNMMTHMINGFFKGNGKKGKGDPKGGGKNGWPPPPPEMMAKGVSPQGTRARARANLLQGSAMSAVYGAITPSSALRKGLWQAWKPRALKPQCPRRSRYRQKVVHSQVLHSQTTIICA